MAEFKFVMKKNTRPQKPGLPVRKRDSKMESYENSVSRVEQGSFVPLQDRIAILLNQGMRPNMAAKYDFETIIERDDKGNLTWKDPDFGAKWERRIGLDLADVSQRQRDLEQNISAVAKIAKQKREELDEFLNKIDPAVDPDSLPAEPEEGGTPDLNPPA